MSVSKKLNYEILLNKVIEQLQQNLPFVVYKKPNSKGIISFFQKNDTLYFVEDYKENGFVFAPFDGEKNILIPTIYSEIFSSDYKVVPSEENNSFHDSVEDTIAKNNFENLVKKGIEAINEGAIDKVVVSRKEVISISDFDLRSVFIKLLNTYPNAFSYCFFHPKVGLWMGAFSEQLLQLNGSTFYTMSVAGTQKKKIGKKIIWENKEKEEQQIVTDFIVDKLKKSTSMIAVSQPYTLEAGSIVHLKTDINGILNPDINLKQVLDILHPTPAVCGLPKLKAKEFILKNEGYEREYYSGFFGELNFNFEKNNEETNLYVNLRCMQIKNNQAHLYIGCGITKDSIPENEWMETVNKATTIKKVLDFGL